MSADEAEDGGRYGRGESEVGGISIRRQERIQWSPYRERNAAMKCLFHVGASPRLVISWSFIGENTIDWGKCLDKRIGILW